MTEKHTPAPWRVMRDYDNITSEEIAGRHTIKGPSDYNIARIWERQSDNMNPEADAELIAAAPDLLDALLLIMDAFIHKPGDIPGNKARTAIFKHCPDMCEAMVAARYAVDKARGDES